MGKFTLLYFATVGYYSYYWFYRCWNALESSSGQRYFSAGRAAFAVLFVHELFARLRGVEQQRGDSPVWRPTRLAWIYVGAAIGQFLLFYWVLQLQLGCWVRLTISLVVLTVQFYSLYQAQLVVNRLEGDPFGRQNQRLSAQNHIWIILGFYMWFSIVRSCLNYQPAPLDPQPPVESVQPPGAETL